MTDFAPIAVPTPNDAPEAFGFVACEGGVCAAEGVSAAGLHAGFRRDPNRRDMALVVADETCVAAGTFTTNRFCAAPVIVSREHVADGHARAVILNSGNANAATGEPGLAVARKTADYVADVLGCEPSDVLVASTGVIGVELDFAPFEDGVPAAHAALAHSAEAAHDAACAVMTTDTVPKEASFEGRVAAADGSEYPIHLGGFVKGSGMIQPNMATMLCVMSTDAPLTEAAAHEALLAAVKQTFNKVTVDSDTSTNDTTVLLATGKAAPAGERIDVDSPAFPAIAAGVKAVCGELARKIAADGEGEYALITDKAAAKLDGEEFGNISKIVKNKTKGTFLFETVVDGYAADGIDAVIAIDKNGAVSGISIIALGETPGLGSKINDDAFLQRFYGVKSDISIVKSEPKNENEVQGITGSTFSSKGMAKAVNLAVKAYSVMDKEVQPNE